MRTRGTRSIGWTLVVALGACAPLETAVLDDARSPDTPTTDRASDAPVALPDRTTTDATAAPDTPPAPDVEPPRDVNAQDAGIDAAEPDVANDVTNERGGADVTTDTTADRPGADVPPAVCPTPVEVIVYDQGGWTLLGEELRDDASPCADYYLSIAAVSGDHTALRGAAETARIHALGPRFHALAEFSWSGWSAVTGMSWYQKGVEFRRRMEAAGYDPTRDTWEINELPSTTRSTDAVRQNVRDAVRGLFDGPPGAQNLRGAVFIIGHGQSTMNVSVYKSQLESWLSDAPFWVDMNRHVRWWAQESYADPSNICVAGDTVAERAAHTNDFLQHVATLASAPDAPAAVATARSYLSRAYVPIVNGVWQADAYNTTALTLSQMQNFISGQLYSVRAWATTHPYPDGRVGFAWDHPTTANSTDERALASRIASAIHGAYGDGGGSAARACAPSGAYTFCQCAVAGARYNLLWQGFTGW